MTNVIAKSALITYVFLTLGFLATGQNVKPSSSAESLYLSLRSVGLDKTRVYKIREGSLDRGPVHLSLDDGTIAFTEDVAGHVTGAFFKGDAEILLSPPDTTERASLALFTGAAILEEKISTAYFRFNDDVYGELKTSLRAPPDDSFVSDWNTTAQNLAQEDALRLLTSFVDTEPQSADAKTDRFLHCYLQGENLGTFDVRYDSTLPEQIAAGQHRTVDGENYYDVWTSSSTMNRTKQMPEKSADELPRAGLEISQIKVKTRIKPPTEIESTAVLSVVPHRDGKRVLLLELSRLLQVRDVEINGQAVEFIHNQALEGSQLARRGDNILAVILPSPSRAGQKIEMSFDYSGTVLSEAANGLLYVGERGTWYPNLGFAMANFDLEFRYPPGWTLVATGRRTDLRTEGGEQIAHWISERPLPVAGFNLGKFSMTSAHAGTVSVLTYATSNVERGFPQLADKGTEDQDPLHRRPNPLPLNADPAPSPSQNAQMVGLTAARAVEFYQQHLGPFPYSQLSLTQIPGKVSQGWPGLVFLSSYAFLNPEQRERVEGDPKLRLLQEQVIAHETAHQWWGDLVTWSGYRDQWMMEAMANYCALMLLESRNPAQFREIMQKYRDDLLIKNRSGAQLREAGPVTLGLRLSSSHFPAGYEAISYGRGTWLIHMLRCLMRDAQKPKSGQRKSSRDEAFFQVLRKLRAEYEGKPLSTAELLSAFQSELPSSMWYEGHKSLDWFYQGWINGSAVPSFGLHDLKFNDKSGTTTITGTISQGHAPDDLVTSVPLYAVVSGKNVFLGRVFAEGRETQFHISAPAGVRKILLDPEQTLLSRK